MQQTLSWNEFWKFMEAEQCRVMKMTVGITDGWLNLDVILQWYEGHHVEIYPRNKGDWGLVKISGESWTFNESKEKCEQVKHMDFSAMDMKNIRVVPEYSHDWSFYISIKEVP